MKKAAGKKITQDHIETKADEFLFRIRKEKKMTVPEMQKQLGVNDEVMEKWIVVFEENGLIERVYPANPLRPAYLVVKHGK